jgi:hypothetical protein
MPGPGSSTHRLGGAVPSGLADGREFSDVRALVRDSWMRSTSRLPHPTQAVVSDVLDSDALAQRRAAHPLDSVFPLIRSLLAQPARDHGLIMAVGDEAGRLLWVEGDPLTRSRAEEMAFLAGADWSEESMGTSAPALALRTGSAVQVLREEHFSPLAVDFSCSAVPLLNPHTGARLGFLDLTGDDRAADSLILPYLRATAAAVQAHLLTALPAPGAPLLSPRTGPLPVVPAVPGGTSLPDGEGPAGVPHGTTHPGGHGGSAGPDTQPETGQAAAPARRRERIEVSSARPAPGHAPSAAVGAVEAVAVVQLTGPELPELHVGAAVTRLSLRHAEILGLLAAAPHGLEAGELSARLYPAEVPAVTLRAELARLRKVLDASGAAAAGVELTSRPYRLSGVDADALCVARLLDRGSHRQALARYRGELLPASEAPGVLEWRDELAATLREAIVSDGSVETLLEYLGRPEARYDDEAMETALRLLPPRSPKRAGILTRLEALRSQIA